MPDNDAGKGRPLTSKEKLFVEHYVICWNASEAARRAGYSKRSAYSIGHDNLRKPDISRAIKEKIDEVAMIADEVLIRLAEHARGDLGDFLRVADNGDFRIDLSAAQKSGKLRLLSKAKTVTRLVGEDKTPETTVEIEMYDAQAALVHLGRYHKLFTDKLESAKPYEPNGARSEISRKLAEFAARTRT